jgi:hypothetical protein
MFQSVNNRTSKSACNPTNLSFKNITSQLKQLQENKQINDALFIALMTTPLSFST